MCKKVDLFNVWCALNDKHVNIGVFILHQLVEFVKIIDKNVIGGGGIAIAIAKGLTLEIKFGTLEANFL